MRGGNRERFGRWMLDVGCWTFLFFIFSILSLAAQTSTDSLPALAPPLPELPPTFWEQHGTVLVMIALLVLVAVTILVVVLLRPKRALVVPPEQVARRALTELASRTEDGAVLSQVSQILRRYFVAVFALPPGEYTTAEFARTLSARQEIGPELAASTTDFLRACDERKFSAIPQSGPPSAAARALELVGRAEARHAEIQQAATIQAGGKTSGPP